jgi:hypothetical protein
MSWNFLHLSTSMKFKSLRHISATLLVLVIFSLTLSIAFASPKNDQDNTDFSISKNCSLPTNSDNQLPYEERETEKDDEVQHDFYLVSVTSDPVFIVLIEEQATCCKKAQVAINEVTDVPLYLSKKALLI